MAPFSKSQIGYIKAVAGVGQHKSFINYSNATPSGGWPTASIDDTITAGEYTSDYKFVHSPVYSKQLDTLVSSGIALNFDDDGKSLRGTVFCLNNIPVTVDHTDTSADINSHLLTQYKFAHVLTPNKMFLLSQPHDPERSENAVHGTYTRVGEDFYVESTHIRWRFTMPDFTVAAGKQPHHEYRFIVFRQRKPTIQRNTNKGPLNGQWLNWNYDLFSGYEGRRVGWMGYRPHDEFDADEAYRSGPVSVRVGPELVTQKLTTDDIMTMPLNDADYVIMRDERFFLGAEHGKSHYETVTRFDWSDPGSSNDSNLILGMDENKNYDWWFLVLGTTNDSTSPNLNISVRGVTAVTSA